MIGTINTTFGSIQVEGDSNYTLFKNYAKALEVFGPRLCGRCNSNNTLVFKIRGADSDNEYLYVQCSNCDAMSDYGKNRDSKNIFPKKEWYILNNGAKSTS